ncbi:unnamed protein product [Ranitomeya imitator]|uniref:glutathione transferase n=1 Tax=Ranitomeya imitator TaxID=111125 RepID=A0ABN9LZ37_9NEOB|nr:unnamed protein product [Ranitomeya imitator]
MSIAAASLFGRWRAVTQTALQRPTIPKSPGSQGKHQVTKRRAALSNPMFTLVTSVNVKKTKTTYLPSVSVRRRCAFLCTVSAGQPESRAVTSLLCFPAGRRSHSAEKHSAGGQTRKLPYLLDGDIKLTQSNTILRYIGRKHGLCGNTENEENFVSLFENESMDFRMRIATLSYDPQFEQLKGPYIEKLPTVLARYSRFLGQRHWFVGDQLTLADILIYDALDQHKILAPTCLQNFKNLQDFLIRFEALPPIAAYLKSPRCKKTPINGKAAFWSNK